MSKKVTCPQCKQVFEMDAAGYAEIAKQIHGAEFEHELHQRLAQQQKERLKQTCILGKS